MNFVTPVLLAGGLLVAVPILLHLIMRPAPRLLEFPALRFLRMHREANQRRMRLRHLLLLALRCAAIGLLAAALARPSIMGSGLLGGREAPVAAAFLFDTAPHMDYRHENLSRLEAARDLGLWLLKQLPDDSEVAILVSHSDSAEFAIDIGATEQRVGRLRVAPIARPLSELLADALRLVDESEKQRKEVYLFSDLARSSWTGDIPGRLKQRLAELSDVEVYVIDVGVEQPRNFGLGELRLSAQVLAKNSPLRLEVELEHVGTGGSRSVGLFLIDATGVAQKRGQKTVDWQSDQQQWIEFDLPGLDVGTHQGYLQIGGKDGLAWDDKRFFTVEVKPAWPVLIAATEPHYAIYLAQAIAPEAFREKGQAWFDCHVISLGGLGDEVLDDYEAVCLLDPAPLNAATWQQLSDYATGGGGVAIFLGRHAVPIDSFNAAAAQQLLPGRLTRQSRQQTYLAPESLQHALLARFRPWATSVPWSAFPVFKYWQLDSLADGVNVIIPYTTNDPALVERLVGEGRVLTMTTPVSDPANLRFRAPWNLLPTGPDPWPFLMLSTDLMTYLVGSGSERLNYLAGQRAVLRLESHEPLSMFSLSTPRGDQLRQTADLRTSSIEITATGEVGNYRVRAGGEVGGLDRGFSVNVRPELTRIERASQQELDEWLGEGRYRIARTRDQIERDQGIGRVGRELFPFLIILVALVLAAEHVLSNRFYRNDP